PLRKVWRTRVLDRERDREGDRGLHRAARRNVCKCRSLREGPVPSIDAVPGRRSPRFGRHEVMNMADSFYALRAKTLDGKDADLSAYQGKVTLVVNVASECGYTPQYAGLEKLHRELSGRGFSVLGFPSNDFGGQEPGTPEEIATFCEKNY